MKLSISLPADDVEFLDAYVAGNDLASRSAAVHTAIRLLRAGGLGSAYEAAWSDWAHDDQTAWEATVGDGVGR